LGWGTSLSLFGYKNLLISCSNLLAFWKYNSPSPGTATSTLLELQKLTLALPLACPKTSLSKATEQAFIDRGEGDKINHPIHGIGFILEEIRSMTTSIELALSSIELASSLKSVYG